MENEPIITEGSQPENKKTPAEGGPDKNEVNIPIVTSLKNNNDPNKKIFRVLRSLFNILISLLSVFLFFIIIIYVVPALQEKISAHKTEITSDKELKKDPAFKKQLSLITRDIERLSRKYNAYTSGQSYIVINTTDNRFSLYKNKKLIRDGFCSTGKLTMLKTEKGDKVWVFKTPKGKRWIHGKITNPSWTRPDWSFIEEGLPVPSKNDPSRYESGVLGDYAMSMGDGYLIHGTIYKRFLGMPVTHGCVRLNDEDLEAVYNTLNIGSKVFIF
jgi:lipoprotein-anchoring transpeptidase ErfK/SrfK